jgi:hypothetical protein
MKQATYRLRELLIASEEPFRISQNQKLVIVQATQCPYNELYMCLGYERQGLYTVLWYQEHLE